MLHAILHGKLEPTVPEPQRLEDTLTSCVFGTLVVAGAWELLANWLCFPPILLSKDGALVRECWFWPRLAFAEPDVVFRIGETLAVVEAKYRSGRHDLLSEDDAAKDDCDQLVRQYRSVTTPLTDRVRYSDEIECAIKDCHLVQVFLVDARRVRRARRELAESITRLPSDALISLATWQSLYSKLNDPKWSSQCWAADLRAYLRISGLATFDGVPRELGPRGCLEAIRGWALASDSGHADFRGIPTVALSQASTLHGWRAAGRRTKREGIEMVSPGMAVGSFQTVIKAWCDSGSVVGTQKRGSSR